MNQGVWSVLRATRSVGDSTLIFRLLIALILILFAVFAPDSAGDRGWAPFYAVGSYIAMAMGLSWFERRRRRLSGAGQFLGYLIDIGVITFTIYCLRGWQSDLYLAYFIVIFMSVKGANIRQNIMVGLTACVVYGAMLTRSGGFEALLGSDALLRFPFLLIVSIYTTLISMRLGESEDSLREANARLREANERLEGAVEARTEGLKTALEQLRLLNEIVYRSFKLRDLEELWPMLSDRLKAHLDCERVSFFVQDADGNLDSVYADGLEDPIHLPAGKGIAGTGVKLRRAVFTNEPYTDPDFNAGIDESSGFRTRNLMACPLIRDGSVTGVAEFVNKEGGFSDADARLAMRLAPEIQVLYDKLKGDRERELMRESLRRSDKFAALGRLMAGLAHEIKNPLTGIGANAQLLLRGGHADGERHGMLQDIVDCVRHCDKLVRNLLVFSRDGAPETIARPLNEVVEGAVKLFGKRFALSGIELEREYAAELGDVHCRETQIHQVLLNILENARQAMPSGGRLTVRTRRMRLRDFLRVRSRTGAGQLESRVSVISLARLAEARRAGRAFLGVLEIEDTGDGIPGEIRDRLFEPFFTTKPPGEGSGLGLSVSREIVDQHGGVLLAGENPKGRGAQFTLALPLGDEGPR